MSNENEVKKDGNISVTAENIFPVIKKWLYSDKEIFLREIVSNACDAVTKMKRLASLGEREAADDERFRIDVTLDPDEGTLTVSDNGIGMTREEVERYICNIALSGAIEFMDKYEKESSSNGIIGHFGLGFYSAFMVSDRVEVRSRSYLGGETTLWVCDGNGAYRFEETEARAGGTDVIMHLSEEEGKEFLSGAKIREVLEKYCAFMPTEIYFKDLSEKEDGAGTDEEDGEGKEKKEEKPINDTSPLWLKDPSECTEEEYKEFFTKVFHDYREPLFHIHLNVDYPLCFKGILYFPKINEEYENLEGQVKLYYNQVFVADNIKEVIPEYFLMLKGVLDCPELPLNVSRSYLQNSGYVAKIAAHIVKKTADKLCALYNTDRENYEKIYDDLRLFVEYGCLKDGKFYDRVKDVILYKTTSDRHLTLKEYLAAGAGDAAEEKDKEEKKEEEKKEEKTEKKTVYYCTDKLAQSQYLSLYEQQGLTVLVMDRVLDGQFLSFIESKENVRFLRVDAEIGDELKGEGALEKTEELTALFREASNEKDLKVEFTPLKDGGIPAVIKVSEQTRRMNDMMKAYGMDATGMKDDLTLVLNTASPLIKKLEDAGDGEKKKAAAAQIYGLALLCVRRLTEKELSDLLTNAYKALELGL
ncbi:MAG: molecular chaperone HtpG [Clostridia bacterium]|nr:molecular chaperone HtpG [Clostridia bacterium]